MKDKDKYKSTLLSNEIVFKKIVLVESFTILVDLETCCKKL